MAHWTVPSGLQQGKFIHEFIHYSRPHVQITVLKYNRKYIDSHHILVMRLQLVQKVENAHEDSIWTVSWVPGKKQFVTGSVDENVNIWEESGSAEEVTISEVHTLVGSECLNVECPLPFYVSGMVLNLFYMIL